MGTTWTEVLAGDLNATDQRLHAALGESASDVVEMVKSDQSSAQAIADFAVNLSREWRKNQRVRIIEVGRVMEVNLDAAPSLPFDDGAKVEYHQGSGWVRVEKYADGLYIGGKKVILHLSEKQLNGKTIRGHELREKLSGKLVLNSNVMDALLEHPEFIPEEWKKDAKGNTIYIFFWGTIFRFAVGGLYVRYLYWRDGRWDWSCRWLDDDWYGSFPAAVCAE